MSTGSDILDRAAELRTEPGVVERLRAAAGTRVVVVRDRRLRVADRAVVRVDAGEVGDADWALLGRDADGAALLLASVAPETGSVDAAPEETWLGLREVGGLLEPFEAEIFVTAVAVAAWLVDVRHCSRCGSRLELRSAGWSRHCGTCNSEHFPRTDPAVIVAVESPDGERLLLGANAAWRGTMYSCFAGFVEAGESMEATVHRELAEEAGVRLSELRYVSSQPWPYPRSLMVGFRAVAVDEDVEADGEEIIDVRWLTRDEIGQALAGDGPVGLPSRSSIARRLIEDWYGEGRPERRRLIERSERGTERAQQGEGSK
ncbi:NAD(+) diphosphatase [Microbacterium esteraromaticum]|uniref:NAD(+) diphosphatase n=1 Tax=Microbacterium esteraromaticum TaxID=57043 RepID=A0A7D8ADI2_9MICO|nr:NAD(+) diphosphatase [Microbacterium esteraromaticum]QMU97704.1 NAD(+) diphosphatase [Microbacterium esteraromaticum]